MDIGGELLTLMKAMQVQMKEDMKENSDRMKTDNEKLKKELMEGVKAEVRTINGKIDEIVKETENVKRTVEENKIETSARFARMEHRMTKMEMETQGMEAQKRKREEILKTRGEENDSTMSKEKEEGARKRGGGGDPNFTLRPEDRCYAGILKGGKVTEKENTERETEKVEVLQFKSTWAREMSRTNLEDQLKLVKVATEENNSARMEGREPLHKIKQKKVEKVLKLGDSVELHSNADWDWEENTEDWDGTTDRVEKNRIKKQKEAEKKKYKIEKAAKIGQCTMGIGPIKNQSIDYFYKITGDYLESQKLAVVEFLQEYLRFDSDELSDLNITDTRKSKKGDEIIFVVFDSAETVRNVRRRIGDCQDDAIKTREYVPPQFFERHNTVSKFAADSERK